MIVVGWSDALDSEYPSKLGDRACSVKPMAAAFKRNADGLKNAMLSNWGDWWSRLWIFIKARGLRDLTSARWWASTCPGHEHRMVSLAAILGIMLRLGVVLVLTVMVTMLAPMGGLEACPSAGKETTVAALTTSKAGTKIGHAITEPGKTKTASMTAQLSAAPTIAKLMNCCGQSSTRGPPVHVRTPAAPLVWQGSRSTSGYFPFP
jgi:hypothetical protein